MAHSRPNRQAADFVADYDKMAQRVEIVGIVAKYGMSVYNYSVAMARMCVSDRLQ